MIKKFRSENYNYNFHTDTGLFQRWGKTKDIDPQRSNFGPEIADIEITTICKFGCSFCYKDNNKNGYHMTIEQYKKVLDKLDTNVLTQVALGADSTGFVNPDTEAMLKYSREKGIIPNITIAELKSDKDAETLVKYCGAVSVSFYTHNKGGKNVCYDTIDKLYKAGLKQINMHFMISNDTVQYIDELIEDVKNDPRLKGLNAVVLLSLKQKGRGTSHNILSQERYSEVLDKFFENKIAFGSDSCGAAKVLNAIRHRDNYKELAQYIEGCESGSFSIYVDAKGYIHPCSFMEDVKWNSLDWEDSSLANLCDDSIKDSKDFLDNIWNSDKLKNFGMCATNCLSCNMGCQVYEI